MVAKLNHTLTHTNTDEKKSSINFQIGNIHYHPYHPYSFESIAHSKSKSIDPLWGIYLIDLIIVIKIRKFDT